MTRGQAMTFDRVSRGCMITETTSRVMHGQVRGGRMSEGKSRRPASIVGTTGQVTRDQMSGERANRVIRATSGRASTEMSDLNRRRNLDQRTRRVKSTR